MSNERAFVRPEQHLVTDEVISIPFRDRGEPWKFRLRIWRRRDAPAVVLVSQIEGQPEPDVATVRLANYVYQAYLHCNRFNFYYWESEIRGDAPALSLVLFEEFGRPERRRFIKPITRSKRWIDLEELIGDSVSM